MKSNAGSPVGGAAGSGKRPPELRTGVVARDTVRDRVGEVMDFDRIWVHLRPLGGGREWQADREDVVVLGDPASLSARVAVTNNRSRRGTLR
ncbi:hypothetical protein [Streptomyces sp. YIM 98790]|uniref:hypothetical protein n=1 Tax=Streptomyces sp. YIM 98790 TaxID=2689077 RepID=UPI00140C91EA|nr:hypothetical protein [Streptomyces sp. YIM 98790]